MGLHFKNVRVAAVALFAATCLSSGVALSEQRVFVFWPHREPMKMEAQSPVEPLEIELSLPTPFALTIGQPVALDVSTDGKTDGVTYRPAASASMPGLTVNASNGSISGVPTAPAGTTYSIAVEAVRSGTVVGTTPPISKVLRATIEIDLVPDDIELATGEPFPSRSLVAGATGGDQDTITWSLENAPEWLAVAAVSPGGAILQQAAGTDIAETPAATVTIVASDAEGRQDTDTFIVKVSTVSIALAVPSQFGLTTGQPVSLTLEGVSDLDGIEYVAADDSAMEGLTVNQTTGTVSGTPNGPAGTEYHIAVDAMRNNVVIASTSVDRILRDPLAMAMVPSGLELTVGDAFPTEGVEITVSGGDQASVSWSLENAPAWLAVEETGDGTAVLTQAEGKDIIETAATTVTVVAKDHEGREVGSEVAVEVNALAPLVFQKIAADGYHSCGITETSDAYCWGRGSSGQLGNDGIASSAVPVPVSGGLSFTEISAGFYHACGITDSGAAYCWGRGPESQLGNDSTTSSAIPVPVSRGLSFTEISAGSYHACGITDSGAAYCWGRGGHGQLGNDSTADSAIPVPVSGGLSFMEISAGVYHSCGITDSGAAYCWGMGVDGQLGNDSTTSSAVPVPASGGLSFTEISAGYYHSCGITDAGEAYCWGRGGHGQLGIDGTTSSAVPVPVSGGLSFTEISAGVYYSCGITDSGAAYCWGMGDDGQLGNYSTTESAVPVPVSGGMSFTEISAGYYHSCGITETGDAYCWGMGDDGQLGNGNAAGSLVPVAVVR